MRHLLRAKGLGCAAWLCCVWLLAADSAPTDTGLAQRNVCNSEGYHTWGTMCASSIVQFIVYQIGNQLRANKVAPSPSDADLMCDHNLPIYWRCLRDKFPRREPVLSHKLYMACEPYEVTEFFNHLSVEYVFHICNPDNRDEIRRYAGCLAEPEILPKQQQCTKRVTKIALGLLNYKRGTKLNDCCSAMHEAMVCAGDFIVACCGAKAIDVFGMSLRIFPKVATFLDEDADICTQTYTPDASKSSCNGFLYPPIHGNRTHAPHRTSPTSTTSPSTSSTSSVKSEARNTHTPPGTTTPPQYSVQVTVNGLTTTSAVTSLSAWHALSLLCSALALVLIS